jgi:hypothetical protein
LEQPKLYSGPRRRSLQARRQKSHLEGLNQLEWGVVTVSSRPDHLFKLAQVLPVALAAYNRSIVTDVAANQASSTDFKLKLPAVDYDGRGLATSEHPDILFVNSNNMGIYWHRHGGPQAQAATATAVAVNPV